MAEKLEEEWTEFAEESEKLEEMVETFFEEKVPKEKPGEICSSDFRLQPGRCRSRQTIGTEI